MADTMTMAVDDNDSRDYDIRMCAGMCIWPCIYIYIYIYTHVNTNK